MKHIMHRIALVVTFVGILTSCQSEIYSCDPKIDKWAHENISTIQTMTRSEWKCVEPQRGQACIVACLPQQKFDFWIEKLDQVLTLDWNNNERDHILDLKNFICGHSQIFGPELYENENLYDIFDRFMYEWSECAQNDLHWTKQTIWSIAASLYDVKNKNGELELPISTKKLSITRSESTKCNCNLSHDFCGDIGIPEECQDSDCDGTSHGCGWLIVQKCNGRCGNNA